MVKHTTLVIVALRVSKAHRHSPFPSTPLTANQHNEQHLLQLDPPALLDNDGEERDGRHGAAGIEGGITHPEFEPRERAHAATDADDAHDPVAHLAHPPAATAPLDWRGVVVEQADDLETEKADKRS
jgi:hypothetical protein